MDCRTGSQATDRGQERRAFPSLEEGILTPRPCHSCNAPPPTRARWQVKYYGNQDLRGRAVETCQPLKVLRRQSSSFVSDPLEQPRCRRPRGAPCIPSRFSVMSRADPGPTMGSSPVGGGDLSERAKQLLDESFLNEE